jgi:hypothetical protein
MMWAKQKKVDTKPYNILCLFLFRRFLFGRFLFSLLSLFLGH